MNDTCLYLLYIMVKGKKSQISKLQVTDTLQLEVGYDGDDFFTLFLFVFLYFQDIILTYEVLT